MPKLEFEPIFAPYEFEERGNLFIQAVAELAQEFPDLSIGTENKTLKDLEANSWACKRSIEQDRTKMYEKAFERGLEKDIRSKSEMTVEVAIHGAKRKRVTEFKKVLEKKAKEFGGKKTDEDSATDPDPKSEYKFYTFIDYCFRG